MALPFFYIPAYSAEQNKIMLDEDTSKHVVQVLRMKAGEQLNLTDGRGSLLTCEIADAHKKHCTVEVRSKIENPKPHKQVSIAISLLKNTNRFEWFLEKATEIGVSEIIPLLCERTEKEKFRYDRLNGICISAMLQSQQTWLPLLHQPVEFTKVIQESVAAQKYIAYCESEDSKRPLFSQSATLNSALICIGPEGDFTPIEVRLALQNKFIPVSLGETRLRTETAGIVAATLLWQD
jgi:16S rRNA (uracil1498-N3)-methyltransferase